MMKEIKGFKSIRESFGTRQVKYGGYAALITLAVIVGLVLLNLIVGQFSPQIDLTGGGVFSLSEQTTQVVDEIASTVNLYGLWQPGTENQQLTEVIDLYLARSQHIKFQVVDPNKNPGLVARFDKTGQGISPGSLAVEGEKGSKIITPTEMYDYTYTQSGSQNVMGVAMERRITMALLFVATGETPVIYEITGHQEYPLAGLGIQELIERENFAVRQLNLLQSAIPEDASALVLHAPRFDLTQAEADKILDYLEAGGRFMVMADLRMGELPMLNTVMESYGMRFDFGYLMENDLNYTAGNAVVVNPDLPEHDITAPLTQQQLPVLLQLCMGISRLPAVRRSIELKPLLVSSANSFVRTDLENASTTKTDLDIAGPITIGMTAMDPNWLDPNNPEPQARIVAIANGGVLGAQIDGQLYGQYPGNIDLFMNSITWLEDRPETLTVRSKSMFLLPMNITGFQIILFGVIIVIVIPLGFFIAGLVIWLRRRHL